MVFVIRYHEEGKTDGSVDPIQDSGGSRVLIENKVEGYAREHAERLKDGDAAPQISHFGITWVVYDAADKVGSYYMEKISQ